LFSNGEPSFIGLQALVEQGENDLQLFPLGRGRVGHLAGVYDVAEHLRTPKEMAAYLECVLEESNGDASRVAKAIGDIARARGMSQVEKDSGLSRESLYKALSGERSPGIDTILKVISALGIKLHAEART
jgi:probable addiction module antidote protein